MKIKTIIAAFFITINAPGYAQIADVEIKTTKITDGLYMLKGRGGNIGVSIGEDGVFMIDDQFAPLSEKIDNAVKELSPDKIKFVVNTHWHGDHTGGNEHFGNQGSMIVAHKNVRKRMSTDQVLKAFGQKVTASPPAALPVITFDRQMTFYFNGEEINVMHIPRGHTDGDSILHFKRSNVIHAGDLFFNGSYPFIDTGSGGSFEGLIAAAEKILALSDDKTQIIPGHGSLATRQDMVEYVDMLNHVRNILIGFLNDKKTLSAVEVEDPLAKYNSEWGQGFMKPEVWLRIIYQDLAQN